jgi:hypothetical protein
MAKIDLDALSIEELAELRERTNAKLLEKVAARQAELEAELEKLSQYGKPAKKALVAAAAPKPRKGQDKGGDQGGEAADTSEAVAKAA